jgi:hypothetical protein
LDTRGCSLNTRGCSLKARGGGAWATGGPLQQPCGVLGGHIVHVDAKRAAAPRRAWQRLQRLEGWSPLDRLQRQRRGAGGGGGPSFRM